MDRDTVVVGAGPNGLAAAITLARAGRSVVVLEGAETVGGGCRSAELTLPGVVHDVCAAVHPMAAASPFLRDLPLARLGVALVHPEVPLAHPLDDGTAVVLDRSVAVTAAGLGPDAARYARLVEPLAERSRAVIDVILGHPLAAVRHPSALARLAPHLPRSATGLGARFRGERARALLAGSAAHAAVPLEAPLTGGLGVLLMALGHAVGWPVVRGGSQRLVDALAAHLRELGGEIATGRTVRGLSELRSARAVLLDIAPRSLPALAGAALPPAAAARLARYPLGPGAFKVDWALDGPIPWRAPGCAGAGTLHLGGSAEEIAAAERAVARGGHPERPFVLLAQPGAADPSRAPEGVHVAWGYCHVPNGSTRDMTAAIEDQVERFAPGFRQRIIGRATRGPAQISAHNPSMPGGDFGGGLLTLRRALAGPMVRPDPYRTPIPGVYLCSSATPPGGGVHGMCGHRAARSALRRDLRLTRAAASRRGAGTG